MVILDTPGLFDPSSSHLLHRSMLQTAKSALADADVIVYLIDASQSALATTSLREAAALEQEPRAPVLTVFNKIDVLAEIQRQSLETEHPQALQVSALSGEGVAQLMERLKSYLPQSPFLYPEDDISSQSTRFFVRELIRETALDMLEEEVPYGMACEIEEFREGSEPVYIRAVLHVERKSQKAIVVGAQGSQIREIGKESRRKIEELLDARVYLDLWVKVLPNWRRSGHLLKRLGYNVKEDQSK
jgi:GTP-binding protein Era